MTLTPARAAHHAPDPTTPARHVNPGDRVHDGRRWVTVTGVHPNGPYLRLTYVRHGGGRFTVQVLAPGHLLAVQPAPPGRVSVTWPGSQWQDPDTVTGTVVVHHDDGIDIRSDVDGDTFTLFDRDLAPGRATLVALP